MRLSLELTARVGPRLSSLPGATRPAPNTSSRTKRKTLVVFVSCCCAVIIGACGKDTTGPSIDQLDPALASDVAEIAADGMAEDVDVMREPVFFPLMPFFGAAAATASFDGPATGPGFGEFRPTNCPFDAATNRLVCPTISHFGITINRSYAFWDAANAVQQAYDATTTAKANIQTIGGRVE